MSFRVSGYGPVRHGFSSQRTNPVDRRIVGINQEITRLLRSYQPQTAAVRLMEAIRRFEPDGYTFNPFVRYYASRQGNADGILELMANCDVAPDNYTLNNLISGLIEANTPMQEVLVEMRNFVSKYRVQPNTTTLNCLLNACLKNKDAPLAKRLLREFSHLEPDGYTFSILGQICALDKDVEILAYFETRLQNIQLDLKALNAWLNVYAVFGNLAGAERLFLKAKRDWIGLRPDRTSFTALIKACEASGNVEKAEGFLLEIKRNRWCLDSYVLVAFIKVCSKAGRLDRSVRYFDEFSRDSLLGFGEGCISYVQQAFIEGCYKSGNLRLAEDFVLRVLPNSGFYPTKETYDNLIWLCGSKGFLDQALEYVDRVKKQFIIDEKTWERLFKVFAVRGDYQLALDHFRQYVKGRYSRLEKIYEFLIAACVKEGRCLIARKILESVENPTLGILNAFIHTCVLGGQLALAEAVLEKMKQKQVQPDKFTYTLLIKVCGQAKNIRKARYYFDQINPENLDVQACYEMLMVSCLTRDWQQAMHVKNLMHQRNIPFNIKIFDVLLRLCAETKVGLDVAEQWVDSMRRDFGIEPDSLIMSRLALIAMRRQQEESYRHIFHFFFLPETCFNLQGFNKEEVRTAVNLFMEYSGPSKRIQSIEFRLGDGEDKDEFEYLRTAFLDCINRLDPRKVSVWNNADDPTSIALTRRA